MAQLNQVADASADLSRGLPEISRIMMPGGRVLCVEALSYNPVTQLYRKRTPAP